MHAAREVFIESGYDAATFQAIAAKADLTRPAINHYFASKEVLYREVLERTYAMVVSAGIANAKAETTFIGRLSAYMASAIRVDSTDRSAAAFLVTSVLESRRHPELVSIEHCSMENSRSFLKWVIEDAIDKGELRTDADVPSLVEMLGAMVWGMGFYAGYVGTHEQLEVVARRFLKLLRSTLWSFPPQSE